MVKNSSESEKRSGVSLTRKGSCGAESVRDMRDKEWDQS